ncbi:hypothetical protein CSC45_4922 [Pseudomonas aeruginosa]|nr:hypothetical protein CSC45_4922 [Pseudomonas aeruginosa]
MVGAEQGSRYHRGLTWKRSGIGLAARGRSSTVGKCPDRRTGQLRQKIRRSSRLLTAFPYSQQR